MFSELYLAGQGWHLVEQGRAGNSLGVEPGESEDGAWWHLVGKGRTCHSWQDQEASNGAGTGAKTLSP